MATDGEMNWNIGAQAPLNPPVPVKAPNPDVSEDCAALVEDERALVKEFGFKHDDGKLLYAPGTKLWDIGHKETQRLAAEYAALPTVGDAATAHANVIKAELRKESVITPANWKLDSSGKLYDTSEPKRAAGLSDSAWSQLCAVQSEIVIAPTDTADVRAAKGAALDAPRGNINAWISQVPTTETRMMRVRTHRGVRQIFGVMSNSSRGYTVYDSHTALADLARILPDAKCEMTYDADTTRLRARAIFQAPIDIPAFTGVGRVHRIGIQFTTRDDGGMSLCGQGIVERGRCKNFSRVMEKAGIVRRKHTGTYAELQTQIRTLVGKMPELIERMRALWSKRAAEFYLDGESGKQLTAPEAIKRLVAHGHVSCGGLSTEDATAAYVAAWRAEDSPHSVAGVIMAIQRAAHETTWKTRWTTDDIEEHASGMLYQSVSVLRLDEPESAE